MLLNSTCFNICMFDWSVKNGGKSQGILISCVSSNPDSGVLFKRVGSKCVLYFRGIKMIPRSGKHG